MYQPLAMQSGPELTESSQVRGVYGHVELVGATQSRCRLRAAGKIFWDLLLGESSGKALTSMELILGWLLVMSV